MDASAPMTVDLAPRISSSDLSRRPGQIVDRVLRQGVIIVQHRGNDKVALVDIEEYKRLVRLANLQQQQPSLLS